MRRLVVVPHRRLNQVGLNPVGHPIPVQTVDISGIYGSHILESAGEAACLPGGVADAVEASAAHAYLEGIRPAVLHNDSHTVVFVMIWIKKADTDKMT